ncbi:hypothetical protein M405DRAFT_829710, partial [Rhizopogon salebrosus TDB-379]
SISTTAPPEPPASKPPRKPKQPRSKPPTTKEHSEITAASSQTNDQVQRDAGVDDATWTRLQADKAAAEAAEKTAAEELRKRGIAKQKALDEVRVAEAAVRKEALAALKEKQEEEETKRREEVKVQQKLRQMGICMAGL